MDFVVSNWNSRRIFSNLLGHIASKAEVSLMSLAVKHARIYGYHQKDHFADRSTEQKHILLASGIAAGLQRKPDVPTTPVAALIVEFVKSRIGFPGVLSVSARLFSLFDGDAELEVANMSCNELLACLTGYGPDEVVSAALSIFFQVLAEGDA